MQTTNAPAAQRDPEDDLDPAEDLEPDLDEDLDPDDPPAPAAAALADPQPADQPPPDPVSYEITPSAVTGIVRGLASTIPPKGTLLLAIATPTDGEVLVTIVPARAAGETDSAIPLVVRGTAQEIDLQLVEALGHYVPARSIALRTAQQIARDTARAAKHAADAAKARTSASATKSKPPSLTVSVEPKDATLRVVNGADAAVTVRPGVPASLAKGRYIVTVSKLGFGTKIQTVVVGDGPQQLSITLEQSDQVALFGGTPT